MDVKIHSVHFNSDEKLVNLINEKCLKMENFNDTITSIDVYLKLENVSDHIKDKTVEIKANVLKDQIFTKSTTKTFEESFSNALSSMVTQLKKKKELLKHC
jgi:putative sigma-54 modulation protein